ncbi:MAG: hypothetical protein GYB68_03010 [Chloroflexi bacterium]|nr:hypothetical protein [Chloroflexota bacterium]
MLKVRSQVLLVTVGVLVAIALIPLIVLSFASLWTFEASNEDLVESSVRLINENALRALESQAALTADNVAQFLRERDQELLRLRDVSRTREAYLAFAEEQLSEIWLVNPETGEETRFAFPIYRELAFIDPSGQEEIRVVNVCRVYPVDCELRTPSNLLDVSNPANTTFGSETYFESAQQLEPDEIFVGRPIGRYVPDDMAYRGDQFPEGERFEGLVRFITPVEEDGELQGYVMLAVDHIHIQSFIEHIDPSASEPLLAVNPAANNLVYIIGVDGFAVAHIVNSFIAGVDEAGEAVPPFTEDQPNIGPGNFYQMGFLSPIFPELMLRVVDQPQGIVERFTVSDLDRALAYATIDYRTGPNYDSERGFGFVVASIDRGPINLGVEVLTAQFETSRSNLIDQYVGIAALFLVLVSGFAVLLGRSVVTPIRTLTNYAEWMEQRGLSEEELSALRDRPGSGEFALLYRSFGRMAETVQEREEQISELLNVAGETLDERIQELAALEDVGRRLTSSLKIDTVFDVAYESLTKRTRADCIRLAVASSSPDEPPTVLTGGNTSLINDPTCIPEIIPLVFEGERFGELRLYVPGDSMDIDERSFAQQLAAWFSVAIKNAQLFQDLETQRRTLEQANVEIAEANRLKSEFMATMSHELRTPLNAIIGFSDMLLIGMSGDLNEKQKHRLGRIQENGRRLLELINDVLDLSKIEAGRMELMIEPYAPQSLIDRLAGQMDVLAQQQNLEFKVDLQGRLPKLLMGDEKRIEQVIVNLLSNAFKFTEEGTVHLQVSTDEEDAQWTIIVRDTGPGIPPHARDLIFEAFRQVDGSSTREHKGSGLGLAITRNLVTMMGGSIHLSSELGEGSTFTVQLPMVSPRSATKPNLRTLQKGEEQG